MANIIFLDIDGVMNYESAYRNGECGYADGSNHPSFGLTAKKLLNELIEEVDAEIVISSTWRLDGFLAMKKLWNTQEKMAGLLIDVTPVSKDRIRGVEIQMWLDAHPRTVDNYVIIDDDSDMLDSQLDNFVWTLQDPNNKDGFNADCKQRALDIFRRPT